MSLVASRRRQSHPQLAQRGAKFAFSVKDEGRGFDLNKLRQAGVEKANYSLDEAPARTVYRPRFHGRGCDRRESPAFSRAWIGIGLVRQHIRAFQGSFSEASGDGACPFTCSPVHALIDCRAACGEVWRRRLRAAALLAVGKIFRVHRRSIHELEGRSIATVERRYLAGVSLASLLDRPRVGRMARAGLAVAHGRLRTAVARTGRRRAERNGTGGQAPGQTCSNVVRIVAGA